MSEIVKHRNIFQIELLYMIGVFSYPVCSITRFSVNIADKDFHQFSTTAITIWKIGQFEQIKKGFTKKIKSIQTIFGFSKSNDNRFTPLNWN
jgi:hypothetical protein